MNISSTRPQLPKQAKTQTTPPAKNEAQVSPCENFDSVDAIIFAQGTFSGAIPLYGAYQNLNTGLISEILGNGEAKIPAAAGVISNLVGTAALGYGLATGTNQASLTGLGLLVGAGLANGTARHIGF